MFSMLQNLTIKCKAQGKGFIPNLRPFIYYAFTEKKN